MSMGKQTGLIILEHMWYFQPNYQHYFCTVNPLSMEKWIWLFFLQKKLWFSGLSHIYPKYIPNMILAIKNFGNSHHMFVVGDWMNWNFDTELVPICALVLQIKSKQCIETMQCPDRQCKLVNLHWNLLRQISDVFKNIDLSSYAINQFALNHTTTVKRN